MRIYTSETHIELYFHYTPTTNFPLFATPISGFFPKICFLSPPTCWLILMDNDNNNNPNNNGSSYSDRSKEKTKVVASKVLKILCHSANRIFSPFRTSEIDTPRTGYKCCTNWRLWSPSPTVFSKSLQFYTSKSPYMPCWALPTVNPLRIVFKQPSVKLTRVLKALLTSEKQPQRKKLPKSSHLRSKRNLKP